MSLLTVLVRESAQNSWDARVDSEVEYRLDLGAVNADKISAWRELLSAGLPSVEPGHFPLRGLLKRQTINFLAVSDRGTAGLGGPTRSDETTEPGANRNWLSFVLNSGDPRDVDGGGGTYGYGKGVFFLASRVGTVLIYTRFRRDDGELSTRLIGSTMMSSYTFRGRPYTGRHWWGVPAEEHCEPLIDDEADVRAAAMGIPGFRSGRTGTTVVVIDPDLTDPSVPEEDAGDLSLSDSGRYLAQAAAWNLWPLTLDSRPSRLNVRVSAGGMDVPVPSEHNDAALQAFADAYRSATAQNAETAECLKPRRTLGTVGYVHTFGANVTAFAAREHGIEGAPHHFACMRRPDLVVSYQEGPAKLSTDAGYAGVFKAADDLDSVFAEAEPPTHDAWVATQLKSGDARFVRVAGRRLKELAADLAGSRIATAASKSMAVGSLSRRLGHLMAGPGALGARFGYPSRATVDPPHPDLGGLNDVAPIGAALGVGIAGQPRPRPRRPQLVGEPVFELVGAQYLVRQRVSVGAGTFRGRCHVVIGGGGREAETPTGVSAPAVFAWRAGTVIHNGDTISAKQPGELDVLIMPVADVAFDIVVEAVE